MRSITFAGLVNTPFALWNYLYSYLAGTARSCHHHCLPPHRKVPNSQNVAEEYDAHAIPGSKPASAGAATETAGHSYPEAQMELLLVCSSHFTLEPALFCSGGFDLTKADCCNLHMLLCATEAQRRQFGFSA
jgi:hypothetical protein